MAHSDISVSLSNKEVLKKNDPLSFLYKGFVFLFLLSTLFDPADKLFNLKVPLFLGCWIFGGLILLIDKSAIKIPINLLMYVFLMIIIPLISIAYYLAIDGSDPFEGFLLLKSYLFFSFALLLFATRVDVLKYLSIGLALLAFSVLALSVFILFFPEVYWEVYHFGERYGIYHIDKTRDYGGGMKFFQMYFVTSSMLVIAIAYYFDKWRSLKIKKRRWPYFILVIMIVCAMFVAGTRNNMIFSVLLLMGLIFLYSRQKLLVGVSLTVIVGVFAILWSDQILALFDPNEPSNYTKLLFLGDYSRFLSDYQTLFFGQGLGAYEYWTGRGYNFVTELTYFEVIRYFGILMGGVILFLMLYPVIYAFVLRGSYNQKSIVFAYATYLLMSATNPLFFSSMGMLILAIVISNIFIFESNIRRYLSSMDNMNSHL